MSKNLNNKKYMIIAIDFDGTCVTHEYPKVGKDIGSVPVLKELVENGHKLILFTMRSNSYLTDAVNWFKENDIPLYGIQTNPTQHTWTTSPKVYAQLYIDDAALGCPLLCILDNTYQSRPFVNWIVVRDMLKNSGLIC
jgi:hypothetical protein